VERGKGCKGMLGCERVLGVYLDGVVCRLHVDDVCRQVEGVVEGIEVTTLGGRRGELEGPERGERLRWEGRQVESGGCGGRSW